MFVNCNSYKLYFSREKSGKSSGVLKSDISVCHNCVTAFKLLIHVSFLYFQAQAVKRAKSEQPSVESKNDCSSKDKELVQSNVDENGTESESVSNSGSKDAGNRASPDVEQTEVEEQNDLPKKCESETESKEEKTTTKNTNNKKEEKRRSKTRKRRSKQEQEEEEECTTRRRQASMKNKNLTG